MTILAYFQEVRFAANAIDQLSQNPDVKDVSFIGKERMDPEIKEGEPTITQGDVDIEPVYTDAFYGSLLPTEAQVGEYVVNDIGNIIVGGNLLDQFQIKAELTDGPINNLSQALAKIGFDGYSGKITDIVSDGNIVVIATVDQKTQEDIDRLLENHQTIDTDVINDTILNFD